MSYEKLIIVGNLGETPELRTAKDGQPVTTLSVAVNKKRNGQQTTTWWRVTAWGTTAETAVKYLRKGSKVLIEASSLRASAYIGKDDQPHGSLECTADRLVFLDSAPEGAEDETIPT